MFRRLARAALNLRDVFRSADGSRSGAATFLLASVVFSSVFTAFPAAARIPAPNSTVVLAELPPEGRKTYGLIRSGGPFPFEKDGVVFGNRERLLPSFQRGYYREYTVATPGAQNRGARRIVCGGAPRTPDRCYYTADHYSSFREIVE